jgi:uncharacterized RDD family membrane protein YckC
VTAANAENAHQGQRFGLPATGVGSVATMGQRVTAFLIDIALSFLIALLITRPELPRNWSLIVWAAMTVLAVGVFGFTPGQAALGIRVAPLGGRALVGLWSVPRTVLTFLIIPPLLTDADGRGLHDRLCRTVVVRSR